MNRFTDDDTPQARFTGALEGLLTLSRASGMTAHEQAIVLAVALGRAIADGSRNIDEVLPIIIAAVEREAKLRAMDYQATHAGSVA